MLISAGGGGSIGAAPTVNVPADTVFSASTNTFPGWNNPDPSAYAWTLPNTTHWYNFGANISQGVFSFVANTILELIAWVLHIAIYVCSWFSDPKQITDPVVQAAGGIFRTAYDKIFMQFLPVLVMMFVAYLAWKYVVAHHAKMLMAIISTCAATALVTLFFFQFGTVFNTVDSFGQLVTNTAASAVASTAGTNVGSEYDTLWQNYILFPWEYGQFGQFSGKLTDFDVNSQYLNDPTYTYQPDPTAASPDPGEVPIPSTINGKATDWVTLFLSTTNSQGRSDLEGILTGNSNVFATGSPLSTNAVKAANPFEMIPFLVIELLLILAPVIFLIYVGFQLFVREILFIVTILAGIVTIPMAFVPEIGWRITFNWLREAVGHQVERIGTAVYAALLFLVCSLITQNVPQSEFGMMGAFLVDAILFAAALVYRQKIFSIAVNPLSDSVRGVDTHNRPLTMDDYIAQRNGEGEERGKGRTLKGATNHAKDKLAEHFAHMESHDEHHPEIASSHRTADTLHVRADEPAQNATHEQKPKGHLSDSFKENAISRQKFARNTKDLRQALGSAVQQHLNSLSNPGAPLTNEERIRRRETRVRGIEANLHRHSVKALRRTIMSVPKLASGFGGNPPDDNPPPPPPPGGRTGPDFEMRRKMMITPDGRMAQGVIFDLDDNVIAYDPPSVARPHREKVTAEVDMPTLAEGFNVPMQDANTSTPVNDVPASSAINQQSQPASIVPTERVPIDEQPGQATLSTNFTSEAQSEPESIPDQARLLAEKPVLDRDENGAESKASIVPPKVSTTQNGTDIQSAPEPVPEPNSEAMAPVSARPSTHVQTRPLPRNVTRIQDERQHRQEAESRQREQRSQRSRQQQQGRRVARVRVNDRPRPPRSRGPEL
jgi:hypothetical protein